MTSRAAYQVSIPSKYYDPSTEEYVFTFQGEEVRAEFYTFRFRAKSWDEAVEFFGEDQDDIIETLRQI